MTKNSVIAFLQALGVPKDGIVVNGDWINCSCPLARYNHKGGKDNKPSFGVVVTSDGTAIYRCFSCTPKAEPLENILSYIHRRTGKYPKMAASVLLADEKDKKADLSTPVMNCEIEDTRKLLITVPPDILSRYFPVLVDSDTPRAKKLRNYLRRRKINVNAVRAFAVRYWTGMPDYLAFPMTLRSGAITNLGIRNTKQKENFYLTGKMHKNAKVKYQGSRETGAWFGLAQVSRKARQVYVCEGAMDALTLRSFGVQNAIASGGTSITDKQIANIPTTFVNVCLDSDDAGYRAAMDLYKRMRKTHILTFVDWGMVGIKDPGELENQDQLLEALNCKTSKPQRI